MMEKRSSILDYQRKTLSPEIWEDNKLKPSIKKFIYKSMEGFFVSFGIKGYKEFVSHLYIGSSLATYFYKDDSDLDVKVVVNINLFKKNNPEYQDSTGEDICDELIEAGRRSSFLTAFIPETFHPLDAYFFTEEEAERAALIKYDSLYNLITDEWLKEPKKLEGTLSSSYILNSAKNLAQKYIDKIVIDIDKAKRDSIDFLVLKDYMKTLDKEELKLLSTDFQVALDRVNDDIDSLITDRGIASNLRKMEFSRVGLKSDLEKLMGSLNYSKGNLIYKILQRYGYLRILFEVAALYKGIRIGPDDVINVYKILSGQD